MDRGKKKGAVDTSWLGSKLHSRCVPLSVSFSDLFPSIAAQVDDYLGRNVCLIERSLHVTRFAGYESENGIWILEMKGNLAHRL